jgi:hypothetical protein
MVWIAWQWRQAVSSNSCGSFMVARHDGQSGDEGQAKGTLRMAG